MARAGEGALATTLHPPAAPPRSRRLPFAFRVHLALITVSLLFGGNYVFTKRILATVSPTAWVLFRIATATALLVPLALLLRRSRRRPDRRLLAGLLLASFLGVGLNQILFTEGMARTTPEHSAIVNALIPTWTLIAAVSFGQERLSGLRIASIAISLLGVLYLLGIDRMLGGADGAGDPGASLLGDLLTMGNGIGFALHLVLMKQLGKTLDPWLATAILFLFGTAMIGAWSAPTITADDAVLVTTPPVLWFALYVIIGATVLTYLLNNWALRHTHSSQVALYINVQPLVAAALNSALGAPPPGHRFFVALILVAIGIWLQTRTRRT
jgi:drug/metabolite transporter (DMT)-like permease